MGWLDEENWEGFDDDDAEGIDLGEHEVVHESDRAIKVREAGAGMFAESFWIPRSVLVDCDLAAKGDSGPLVVKRWFAEKEGLA